MKGCSLVYLSSPLPWLFLLEELGSKVNLRNSGVMMQQDVRDGHMRCSVGVLLALC